MSDGNFEFYIDIEDINGRVGAGPITTASKWTYTARTDRAGVFAFEMPATDPKVVEVIYKRKARGWALIGGTWTEVGAGIIDNIQRRVNADGKVTLTVSGDDEIRELASRSIGNADMSNGGAGMTHAAAVSLAINSQALGWTAIPAASPANDYIYGRFSGESMLTALISIANKTQTHFYRSAPRVLTFASDFTPSGIRAIQAAAPLDAATCAITALTETIDTYDLLTAIHPVGAGSGDARLTLRATSRTAPAGYTMSKPGNIITYTAGVDAYGIIDSPWIEFKDVRPISNTDADLQAAADMLFDVALKELKRRAIDTVQATYTVSLAGCAVLLKPLQTLRLVYRDDAAGINVDRDINILSATWEVTAKGIQTTGVELCTSDIWFETEASATINRFVQNGLYQVHPQLNANAYVIPFSKPIDDVQANPAQFRFRFDEEVAQLTRVVFDFQLLPLESTVKTVGLEQSTSGTITTSYAGSSGAESTPNTAGPSTANTGAATGNTAGPSVTNTGAATGTTGNATGNTGTASGNTGNATGDTGGSGTLNTNGATGGDTIASGRHQHTVGITLGATVTYPIGYSAAGTAGGLVSSLPGGSHNYPTNQQGEHTHSLNAHTHTLNSHAHDLNSHAHSLNSHAHDLNSHAHNLNSHTHDLNNHAHGLNSHTHTIAHTHVITHSHVFTPSVYTLYGIFRDSGANTFALSDLEYSVDGATWYYFIPGVNGFADLSGGWYRIDITSLVQNIFTYRPANANNLLQIRRKTAGTVGKKATIDAQMSIRTIIQSIAYT